MATSFDKPTIIFDLDGTLLDCSRRDWLSYKDLLTTWNEKYLGAVHFRELRREHQSIGDILRMTISVISEQYISGFYDDWVSMQGRAEYMLVDSLLPGVKDVLGSLEGRYNRIVVTSRKDRWLTERQLEGHGLLELIDELILSPKMKRQAFSHVLNVEWVVGDTEFDITPAKNLGLKTIGVDTGMRNRPFLEELKPFAIINSLTELLSIVLKSGDK